MDLSRDRGEVTPQPVVDPIDFWKNVGHEFLCRHVYHLLEHRALSINVFYIQGKSEFVSSKQLMAFLFFFFFFCGNCESMVIIMEIIS